MGKIQRWEQRKEDKTELSSLDIDRNPKSPREQEPTGEEGSKEIRGSLMRSS